MKDLLKEKIMVLDGAMGTSIQNYNLTEEDFRGERFKNFPSKLKGANELLNLTRPDIVKEIYNSYIEAGADIIETNTFNGNTISMGDYSLGDLAYEVSLEGTKLAKSAALETGKKVWIAGSVGPSNKSIGLDSSEINFDELKEAYKKQIRGILHGGGDLLLIETIFDGLNAKAAVVGAEEIFCEEGKTLPIMISATVDRFGRLLSGQTMESLVISLDRDSILSFGLNCSFGAAELLPLIHRLGKFTHKPISIYPNAGLPNEVGEYTETPQETAEILNDLIRHSGINIIGGCCGTTPKHIELIAEAVKDQTPRILRERSLEFNISGNEVLDEEGFLIVGERNNVAGSRKFARLIKEKKYDEALEISRTQVKAGAHILDLNLDDGLIDSKTEMKKYIKLLLSSADTANIPIMIDSSDFEIIEEGLKNLPSKGIVNSLSLKDGEEEFIRKAEIVKKYGAALVVMAFDEHGQADTFTKKIAISKRSYDLLLGIGFSPADIIFDTNILTIGTGEKTDRDYAKDYINSIKWIKENLPHAKTSGGLSNVSFAFRGNNPLRHAIHQVFLRLARENGLDMVIMNPAEKTIEIKKSLEDKICSLIMNTEDVLDSLLDEQIEKIISPKTAEKESDPRVQITDNLINGNKLNLTTLIDLLLKEYSPISIIQDILMEGMERVGEHFNSGKLFLPQIVKSAVIMKEAVTYLTPLIKNEKINMEHRGTIVMATVDGDVHDIGKNIVKTVLECNGYKIIDLGVMVSMDKIITAIKNEEVHGLALSGLITPSLHEMARVAKEMANEGINIPLFIGGAATSSLHTAIKIEPNYRGRVFHLTDASNTVIVLDKILGGDLEYKEAVLNSHEKLRKAYKKTEEDRSYLSLEEGFKKREKITNKVIKPSKTGVFDIKITVADIEKYIHWDIFLHDWKVKDTFKEEDILREAEKYLEILKDKKLKISARYGIFNVEKRPMDILKINGLELPMVRTQQWESSLSLADFVENEDYIGTFAVSIDTVSGKTEYEDIMYKLLGNRLTEAAAYYLETKASEVIQVKIRPAVGYPILPDHSMKKEIFDLMNIWELGVTLSSTYTMTPVHTVCGLLFFSENAKYFDLGKIDENQIESLAEFRKVDFNKMKENLGISIC
ncbi:methionine synthase [Psychrilyobacter piezotolerans]|uniref:Methionine synthase n=1 Tax=Psychrilyobacter piezotolerans TaxID=2293438 RepID=A0ABX9KKH9_9FUSO|nr:methionine synthase [Psychrilyobacter piezotolerans]RDE65210.1 methionine synthase [Psychrilyobacter sp. S5]REI42780.1 methionine synthase [Psychrilyobacter piezotolerans]